MVWQWHQKEFTAGIRSGFTLIELVVVLAVLGLLLAVVPVALQRGYESNEYRAAVRELVWVMKSARNVAISAGREEVFRADVEAQRFGLGDALDHDVPDRLVMQLIVGQSEQMSTALAGIRFYPDGSSTGGSVSLARSNGTGTRVRVDWLLGTISIHPLED